MSNNMIVDKLLEATLALRRSIGAVGPMISLVSGGDPELAKVSECYKRIGEELDKAESILKEVK